MFDPDINLYIVGGAFAAISLSAWITTRIDKRNRVLERNLKSDRLTINGLQDQRGALEQANEALRITLRIDTLRINKALDHGAAHPHMRPAKLLDILMGIDEVNVTDVDFEGAGIGWRPAVISAYARDSKWSDAQVNEALAQNTPPFETNTIPPARQDANSCYECGYFEDRCLCDRTPNFGGLS